MVTLTVKQNRIGPILGFHPWVFSQALISVPEGLPSGEPVRLISERGDFLAAGYFSSYSQITVRLWGYEDGEAVDERFFEKRVNKAYGLRRRFVESRDTDSYRLIHGENDLLPGLVVDKYGPYLVVQFHAAGIEAWKRQIVAALETLLQPAGIYERSDMAVRKMDHLERAAGLLSGTVPDLILIRENGLKFLVDVKQGQKTGFFLDQRDKRSAVMRYAAGASVLNCFSYTGGFSVYALAGGAKRVVSVDTSERAIELAKENVKLNGLDPDRCEYHGVDVKSFLRNPSEQFDLVILDPPAFIKDRRKKPEGLVGYKGINEAALRWLKKDGVLVTCSCSAHLTLEEFRFLLSEAGGKTKKVLRFIETYTHGIDHPQLVPFMEGSYLKCFFVAL
jgi:23S rRNA (cytosine1962-C5)-methyltransferase